MLVVLRKLGFFAALFISVTGFPSDKAKLITARIWAFQGAAGRDQVGSSQVSIWPVSSTPEFEGLKTLATGPDDEFKAALIDCLLYQEGLSTLDDLFLYKQSRLRDLPFPSKVILGRGYAYRVDLALKELSTSRRGLRLVISKTKEGIVKPGKDDRTMLRDAYDAAWDENRTDLIVDQALIIELDDPVVIRVPRDDGPYFLCAKLTAGEPEAEPKRKPLPVLRPPSGGDLVPAPRAIEKVLPSYPDELRRRYVRGEIGLRIFIDENGGVQSVLVEAPVHPYLDYAAVQAFLEWKFEPVLQQGKPGPAVFNYRFDFDSRAYADETRTIEAAPVVPGREATERMKMILAGCAEYCRRLREASLFYVCEESINETTHSLVSADRLAELPLRSRTYEWARWESPGGQIGVLTDSPQILNRMRAERISYRCDYQIIRRFGEIEERRIILRENGRRVLDRVELLEEERYSALNPVVSVLNILEEGRQALFHYRVLKEEKVSGKNAFVLEALPKLGDADGVRLAKIWIEKEDYRILRCEIEGVPLDGYDNVLGEAVLLNIRPFFMRTYEFRMENKGTLLPTRSAVRIEYPGLLPKRRETKMKIDLEYRDFRFFIVDTEGAIRQ